MGCWTDVIRCYSHQTWNAPALFRPCIKAGTLHLASLDTNSRFWLIWHPKIEGTAIDVLQLSQVKILRRDQKHGTECLHIDRCKIDVPCGT
jgi:hypothetical protein